ncbi:MAG: hypothetical protein LKJ94_02870 [Candidatus Methanomethylophilus sp.]|jgi:hypothetical protein|nr:hypothetical protein [Methanomethylophilus sp.]MCI2093474.1 hypothetical protein [Methanomethylophilus sp.]WII09161.1 hypothetical protein O8W32_08295 [Methanomassiliicoccales archaeon LGM-DZ1]
MKEKAYPKAPTLVLVITNDSTVMLKDGICSAFELFGGRAQEVKNLVARLDLAKKRDGSKLCEVSFGIVTSHFGYVPADYTVMKYPVSEVMSKPEDYERVQKEKDFLGKIDYTSKLFDRVIVCVPKHMMEMIMASNCLPEGRVIAVTSPDLKEECQQRDWMFLPRNGPRVGAENAALIMQEIVRISDP